MQAKPRAANHQVTLRATSNGMMREMMRYVDQALAHANNKYRAVDLPRIQAVQEVQQAKHEADQAAREEVQRILDTEFPPDTA